MILDDNSPADFATSAGRRKLYIANKMHNEGTIHAVENAQLKHIRSPPHQRLHITTSTAPLTDGFQCVVKATPEKYVVCERRGEGLPTGTTPAGSLESNAHVRSSAEHDRISSMVREAEMDKLEQLLDLQEAVKRDIGSAVRNVANGLRDEVVRHEPRRQNGAGGIAEDVVAEHANLRVPETAAKATHTPSAGVCCFRLPRESLRQLQGVVDRCVAFGAHYGRCSKLLATYIGLSLMQESALSQSFPSHVVTCSTTLDTCSAAADRRLVRLRRVLNEDAMRALVAFLAESALGDLLCELAHGLLKADEQHLLQQRCLESRHASIPWLRERQIQASHITGAILRGPNSERERGYGRSDIRSTTLQDIKDALLTLNEVYDNIHQGHCLLSPRNTISADLDFLHISWDHRGRVVKGAAEPRTNQIVSIEKSCSFDTGSNLPAIFHQRVSIPFTVIEVVLEKKGLPHNFVIDDLTSELAEMMATRPLLGDNTILGDGPLLALVLPQVVVTTHTKMDAFGWTWQYARIRGSTMEHVEDLMRRLRAKDYFTAAPARTSPSRYGGVDPHMTISARRTAAARGTTAAGNPLNGYRREKNSINDATRHKKIVALNAESVLTEDDRAFWSENYYRLHNPRLLCNHALDVDLPDTTTKRMSAVKRLLQTKRDALVKQLAVFDITSANGVVYDYRVTLTSVKRCEFESQRVAGAIASSQVSGFVNYFGPARFGKFSRKNQHPGLHLLRGEYQAAASILTTTVPFSLDSEVDESSGGGMAAACRLLRDTMQQTSTDGFGTDEALKDVFHEVLGGRFMKGLVMEFCCFLWNELVSQRIKRFGVKTILPGDLVLSRHAERSPVELGENTNSISQVAGGTLKLVTRCEIDRGVYTYRDVLLPIPGANIVLPQNETASMMREHLALAWGIVANPENNVWEIFQGGSGSWNATGDETFEDEDDVHALSDYNVLPVLNDDGNQQRRSRTGKGNAIGLEVSGAYRPILGDASSLTAAGVRWDDDEICDGQQQPTQNKRRCAAPCGEVEVTFTLPSSQYASMLLRELSKLDVNGADVLDLAADATRSMKVQSWDHLSPSDKHRYSTFLSKKKKVREDPPMAMVLAQLHRQIFKAGGMRKSLLPSTRGFDDVAK